MNELWDIGGSQASDWHKEGRVTICGGTRHVSAEEIKNGFKRAARVPLDDWRSLTDSEAEQLAGASDSELPTNRISIARLPIPLTDRLRALLRDVNEPLKDEFSDLVQACFPAKDPPIWLGYTWNEEGLLTLSRDDRRGKFNGLHVDSWDREPVVQRAGSRNRISFNIGVGTRYFLFVPISLVKIVNWLSAYYPEEGGGRIQASTLGQSFLRKNPATPVIRLAVHPGEAYIAPTENIIHDGSTANIATRGDIRQYRDEEITLRGRFVQSMQVQSVPEPV